MWQLEVPRGLQQRIILKAANNGKVRPHLKKSHQQTLGGNQNPVVCVINFELRSKPIRDVTQKEEHANPR
ncbi:hypothetical protein DPMN_132433 [Dreissena polymorpha]|uniref:Uncharacterized protein n=1 Tax=Dreissena polymorpha TaxID=45954 RepID=A0A9D4FTU0_DREPO|nr:hypothetical protein DPMN_132433 [Dreissena polymorpha]